MRSTLDPPTARASGPALGRQATEAVEGGWDGGRRLPLPTLEQALWWAVIAAAFLMRIWNLGARAMHHDESMEAFYSWLLYKGAGYQYNPLLHGPLTYHATALMYFLFGVNNTTARLAPVICGTIIVGAVWFLRPYLGKLGALFAAILLAISPSFLYFSRFEREDIYVTCFTLLMVVGLFGWLHTRRPRWIYLLFLSTALAFATKESTFITLFIFGTFVLGVLTLEAAGWRPRSEAALPNGPEGAISGRGGKSGTPGAISASIAAIPGRVWAIGVLCFAVVTVLLFTTLLTNRHGLIDAFTASLQYWLARQGVRRGDQPGYYYALLLPAYEQIPVLFGIAAMGWYVFRRWFVAFAAAVLLGAQLVALTSGARYGTLVLAAATLALGVAALYFGVTQGRLFATFLTYWAILGFIIYSWAGEKMPWLVIHIALPFALLAGMFLGEVLGRRPWTNWRWAAGISAALLALFALHADWPLNYYRGDVPKDMLIYTQTSPQVKTAVAQINQLSNRLTGGTGLQVLVDNNSTWPFAWYLRDYKNLSYTDALTSAPTAPVVITSPENDAKDRPLLSDYVGNQYVLRWWFPEDYRGLTLPKAVQSVTDPAMRKTLWNWLTLRETPSSLGTYDFDVWIRKDLAASSASNLTFIQQQQAAASAPAASQGPDPFAAQTTRIASSHQIGAPGSGNGQLNQPRGIGIAPDGSLYVADQANNRVEKFDSNGKFVLAWGSKGTAPGQFDNPSGVAIDKAGNVWVTDLWNHRVEEFDAAGKFLNAFGTYAAATGSASPGKFFGPRGIAVGPSGDLYVTDTGNKRVQKYSAGGAFETMWGQPGSGPGQFEEPVGIATDAQGNVYVADTWNRRIQKFSAAGAFISQISVGSWPAVQSTYGQPFLAIAPNGVVIATDPLRGRVLVFSPAGTLLKAWGGVGSDASSLSAPTGIAVTSGGQVVVADTLNGRLLVFPPVS